MPLSLEPAEDAVEYDQAVAGFRYSSPLQGWGYGEARTTLGDQVSRFFIVRDGQRVGAMALHRQRLLKGITNLYVPRGPVFDDPQILDEVYPLIKALATRSDFLVKIEPPLAIPGEEESSIPASFGPFKRGRAVQGEHTLFVNLEGNSEQDIFERLHKMARRNVRTSGKRGVTVGRDDDFEAFWHLFDVTNERASISPLPKHYYRAMWEQAGAYGGDCYIILARSESGEALAGGFFVSLGRTTCYLYGGSIKEAKIDEHGAPVKDSKAPDAFYWEAIADALREGYSVLDLWGIPRRLHEEMHSYGIYRMKLKFTEDRYWFPAYEARLSPLGPPLRLAIEGHRKVTNYRTRGTFADIV